MKHEQSRSYQQNDLSKEFHQGRQQQENANRLAVHEQKKRIKTLLP
jgi:hypothetical protein